MPCRDPITAYRPTNGGPLSFKRPQAHTYTEMNLPCGYCILCRQEQSRQWAVRITHEAQLHEDNSFVTLTYDDKNLPTYNQLNYQHLQQWWRRTKRAHPGIRFYGVGEYGERNDRPHYHVCVFGEAFRKDRIILRESPHLLWTSPELQASWGLGHVSVGELNFQTAQYTAGYMHKKLARKKQYVRIDEDTGELVPLEQPRSFSSKHPAIGARWYEKFGDQVHAHDRVVLNGKPQKPPRFYDRLLHKRSEIAHQMMSEQRKENATEETQDQKHARARNAHARAESRGQKL